MRVDICNMGFQNLIFRRVNENEKRKLTPAPRSREAKNARNLSQDEIYDSDALKFAGSLFMKFKVPEMGQSGNRNFYCQNVKSIKFFLSNFE